MRSKSKVNLLLFLFIVLAPCNPCFAWEEADERAFEEKIGIISGLIIEQNKGIDTSSPETTRAGLRAQCLLQSIGIDVVHRYLELNPGDAWWSAKYSRLRDNLSVCLGMMYHVQEKSAK